MEHNHHFPDGERIKAHIKRHKVAYSMGIGIGIGVIVTLALRKPMVTSIAPIFTNNNLPVFNNVVNNGGYMTKLVECVETGEIWKKVIDAAHATGVDRTVMSKHLNGHTDHINGLHYSIVGLGTTG